MRPSTRRTVRRHWAALLDCDPETVFSPGTTVTAWDDTGVELLCWEGGALVGAPADLAEPLRDAVEDVPFDVDRTRARDLVESVIPVDDVLGPQFVGYCDESTLDPVEGEASRVDPRRLDSLRAACPREEWERSGVSVEGETPTFAVLTDDSPVAAVQYGVVDDVAKISVVSHPDHRGEGNATSAVSAATAHALDRDFVAEYRTVERWRSSVALAERLGFEPVARSLLVDPV